MVVKVNNTETLAIKDIPIPIHVLFEKENNGKNHPADNLNRKFLVVKRKTNIPFGYLLWCGNKASDACTD